MGRVLILWVSIEYHRYNIDMLQQVDAKFQHIYMHSLSGSVVNNMRKCQCYDISCITKVWKFGYTPDKLLLYQHSPRAEYVILQLVPERIRKWQRGAQVQCSAGLKFCRALHFFGSTCTFRWTLSDGQHILVSFLFVPWCPRVQPSVKVGGGHRSPPPPVPWFGRHCILLKSDDTKV